MSTHGPPSCIQGLGQQLEGSGVSAQSGAGIISPGLPLPKYWELGSKYAIMGT